MVGPTWPCTRPKTYRRSAPRAWCWRPSCPGVTRDAMAGARMIDLPTGARVGTGSARRKTQLLDLRPDLDVVGLRGNIATRLARVGELDAIVVAFAALQRLGLDDRADEVLAPAMFCPQVGQGAVAVECRADDGATLAALRGGPCSHPYLCGGRAGVSARAWWRLHAARRRPCSARRATASNRGRPGRGGGTARSGHPDRCGFRRLARRPRG